MSKTSGDLTIDDYKKGLGTVEERAEFAATIANIQKNVSVSIPSFSLGIPANTWRKEAGELLAALDDKKTLTQIRSHIEKHPPSAEVIAFLVMAVRDSISDKRERAGARAKLAKDPAQKDKATIKAKYLKWRNGEAKYRNKTDFAQRMHRDTGRNVEAIKRWVRDWDNESASD